MFDFRKTVSFHCLSFCIWHLCFGLIISLILETAPATAAEFDILPPEKQIHFKYKTLEELHIITLSGDIKAGDYDKLKRSVDNIKNDHEFIYNKIQISLNSPGGSFKEAVEIAQYLNEQGIRTYVGAGKRCLSACAIIFMAGTLADGDGMRDPGRYMHHTAQLGFHAPYVYGVNPKLTPEVVPHIVPDAERGASLAASQLLGLSNMKILPTTLVEELLVVKSTDFMMVDNVDRAARWKIPLRFEKRLEDFDRSTLSVLCNNVINWSSEKSSVPESNRAVRPEHFSFLEKEQTLWTDGMDFSCGFKQVDQFVNNTDTSSTAGFQALGRSEIMAWQALPPETKLASLGTKEIEDADVVKMAAKGTEHKNDGNKSVTYWMHNNSKMKMMVEKRPGAGRYSLSIIYEYPKISLESLGIKSGTLLLWGNIEPSGFEGWSKSFKSGCGHSVYKVGGEFTNLTQSRRSFILSGQVPIWEQGSCRITGYTTRSSGAVLKFTQAN